jgi:hypothetical protein
MRPQAVLLLVCCTAMPACAAPRIEEIRANCDVVEPPAGSGEIFHSIGKVLTAGRVYPRLSEIPAGYTGCQVLWSSINGGPRFRSVTYLDAGRVVATQPEPEVPLCEAGEKAAETGCTARRYTLQVSYPPGCAARTLETKSLPMDCIAAFQAEFKLNDLIKD